MIEMVYTTYYKGVQVTSNIPTNMPQPGNYKIRVYWSDNALGWIESKVAEGFAILNNYTDKITTKFMQEVYNIDAETKISNLNFYANNQYAEFDFTTQTITLYDIVGVIVGVVIWGLALATAVIPGVDVIGIGSAIVYTFLDAIGVSTLDWFVSGIDAIWEPIAKTAGPAAGYTITFIIVALIAIALGGFAYYVYKKVE